jgi:predicted Rossmann fold flavoprotein
MKALVIGGGAAGFFAALSCKHHHPDSSVTILEKSQKLLAKVGVSGGGRCNVTHACFENSQMATFYPRGSRQLRKAFHQFNAGDTVEWFQGRGVELKTEQDNRMFPVTDSSQTIIDCLLNESERLGVDIQKGVAVSAILKRESDYSLVVNGKEVCADRVIIASGGSPKLAGFDWLRELGHDIIPPVPSLFTFNLADETMGQPSIKKLMGVVANPVTVSIRGTKLATTGPLLITHWGMSGPAVLKLSSVGARELNALEYTFEVVVNWFAKSEHQVREWLDLELKTIGKRTIGKRNPFQLPNRLWSFLLKKNQIDEETTWGQMKKKSLNALISNLANDSYPVNGKTTFKEEFVTSGGISLRDVSFQTMESKVCPGMYFAGEVLDIDGVTGGFNFQAAWTTGFIAGKLSDRGTS